MLIFLDIYISIGPYINSNNNYTVFNLLSELIYVIPNINSKISEYYLGIF
jgi:hypothetical protein